jgi:hypothetical protein
MFGNAASVLVGDFLYSRAFQMMVSVNRMRVLEVLADATNTIAEGEVLQLMNMHDPDLEVEEYLRVIRFKTAKLFEASARLGAVLGGADSALEERCADYGRSLGTAFQLVDDLLDYEGDSRELGKNVGDDLREGKPTLPLLIAMARGTAAERAADPPGHRTRRGGEAAGDRRHRAPHRSAGRHPRRGKWWRPSRPASASVLPESAARRSARIVCSIGPAFLVTPGRRTAVSPLRGRRRNGV